MGLGQVSLEAMEEEEKHVQSNDGEVYHWGTHRYHDKKMKMRWSPVLLINELWYCARNRSWTLKIDSHLVNCSIQNAFSAPAKRNTCRNLKILPLDGSWWKIAFTGAEKAFCVLQFAKCESSVIVQRRFRTQYHNSFINKTGLYLISSWCPWVPQLYTSPLFD